MTDKERDQITDILNENGYHELEIQEYCFDFLRGIARGKSDLKLIDNLEEAMGS